jgi:hypothetical protein
MRLRLVGTGGASLSLGGHILSHTVLRSKLNALTLCVSGLSFTHKTTNSEINNITSIYYIKSYYKTITRPRGLNSGNKHHATRR